MPSHLSRPAESEYKPAYAGYIALVPDGDLLTLLAKQAEEHATVLGRVPAGREQHRYGPDKWTITEVVGHVADAERVFAYRALRFARRDQTPLQGFDENLWAPESGYGSRRLADVVAEYRAVRAATVALFRGLADSTFLLSGPANNSPVTVRALGYIIAGHDRHHMKILRERYGV